MRYGRYPEYQFVLTYHHLTLPTDNEPMMMNALLWDSTNMIWVSRMAGAVSIYPWCIEHQMLHPPWDKNIDKKTVNRDKFQSPQTISRFLMVLWNWEIWSNISAVQKANLRRLSLSRFTKTTCVASVGTHQPSKCRYANEYPMMLRLLALLGWHMVLTQWASCQIRRMVSYACARNAGNVFRATDFKLNRQ